jgi:hypothetical protein
MCLARYDTVEAQEVRRISFGDFGVLDVLSVKPLEGDASSNAHLFMAPVPGVTDMGDAAGASAAAMPARISLDPFMPYVAQFQAQNVSERRRRLLQQEAPEPQVTGSYEYAANASSASRRSLLQLGGCASTNKCPIKPGIMPGGGGYGNQAVTIAVPGIPFGFSIGPVARAPCMYEMGISVSPTQVMIPLPIVITGSLGVLLCNDLSSYEEIIGTLSAAVGIPGISPTSPLALFNWQIAAVSVAFVNQVQELQCAVSGTGNTGSITYESADAPLLSGMVSRFGASAARTNCACLTSTTQRSGIGLSLSGPDIPGFALLLLPVLGQVILPLAPSLAFVKLRPSVVRCLALRADTHP